MDNPQLYFGKLNQHLQEVLKQTDFTTLFILVDENTNDDCLPFLELPAHQVLLIESGEKHKNIQTCQSIWAELLSRQADRHSILINLGGGVIGDMGGFCAATFKRGIRFINIPTTLLAMVDASVGGKTGVDFMNQKNMIGLFTSPLATLIDPLFLNTLDQRQIKSGQAEMIKHGLIANLDHFEKAIQANEFPLALIKESVEIKQHIVEQDPFEKNIRKSLNFGHTLGHAIESAALSEGNNILHGEAVALGMILELKLSVLHCSLDKDEADNYIEKIAAKYGHPPLDSNYLSALIEWCGNDKKNENKGINCSLMSSGGNIKNNINLSQEQILRIAKN
jgi:3-dehydroquinate synthase